MKTFALKLLVAYAIDGGLFLLLFAISPTLTRGYILLFFLFPVVSALVAELVFALILRVNFSVISSLLAFVAAFFLPLLLMAFTVPDKFIISLVTVVLYNVVSPVIAFVVYGFAREEIF